MQKSPNTGECMQTKNRVALITGCGKQDGIGAASARALAASGVTVVVADLALKGIPNAGEVESETSKSWHGLESLVNEIVGAGGTASWVQGDVTSEADATRMVSEVLTRYGQLDILVNSAGAPHGGRDRAYIEDVPLDAWEKVMAINATGVFLMSRAAVTPMRKQGWGRIISISSIAAKNGRPRQAVYAASKAAVTAFSRSLGVELAPYGITVNAICPGPVLTSRSLSTAKRESGGDMNAGLAARDARVPVGRQGRPEEVAAMVVYLASESSAFVTSQAISICGGIT